MQSFEYNLSQAAWITFFFFVVRTSLKLMFVQTLWNWLCWMFRALSKEKSYFWERRDLANIKLHSVKRRAEIVFNWSITSTSYKDIIFSDCLYNLKTILIKKARENVERTVYNQTVKRKLWRAERNLIEFLIHCSNEIYK